MNNEACSCAFTVSFSIDFRQVYTDQLMLLYMVTLWSQYHLNIATIIIILSFYRLPYKICFNTVYTNIMLIPNNRTKSTLHFENVLFVKILNMCSNFANGPQRVFLKKKNNASPSFFKCKTNHQ